MSADAEESIGAAVPAGEAQAGPREPLEPVAPLEPLEPDAPLEPLEPLEPLVPLVPLDLTVVVPAYNEEHRLRPTLDAVRAYLCADPARWGDWELIVVDDGSTDGTAGVAAEAAAEEPRIRVVASDANHGKGHALRQGVLASRGRRVLVTDADLATPIDELDPLDKRLTADGGGAVIGSRAHPDARIEVRQLALREWLGRLGNRLIQRVAVAGVSDTQCGFKLFDGAQARAAFAESRLDGWGIDVEILRYFRGAGWPVTEVPVRWSHQPGSKVRPLDYVRVLVELVRLRAGRTPVGGAPAGRTPVAGTGEGTGAGRGRGNLRRNRPHLRTDLAVAGLFLLFSLYLYNGLWTDLDHAYLRDAGADQDQWEWFFRVTADNVAHLRNPLFTTFQNYPDGVNLMANTAMFGLSVPLTPVTLAFGPHVTWALVLTLGLAATAVSWYWLFARRLFPDRPSAGRWPAALGAGLAAFAPPMISHATAHPNFCVLFMIPVIIDRALRLCERDARVVRDGVLLGLFATYQIFLGEEPLLIAAMGMVLFAPAYAVARPDVARVAVRPLLRGTGIALLVCLPLLAFPLYWQFFGPQSYHSVLHGDNAGNSPLAFLEYSGRALFGNEETADALAMNRTEQNAFYGWPLIALAGGIVVWLWRLAVVRALAWTAAVAALLSLGPRIPVPFTDVVLPGPWRLLVHQPLFESVIESRVAMICAPVLGALLALAVERLRAGAGEPGPEKAPVAGSAPTGSAPTGSADVGATGGLGTGLVTGLAAGRARNRLVGLLAVAAALIPIVPTAMPVREREEIPPFIAEGMYRSYVSEGETLVPVPLPEPGSAGALYWQSATGMGFSLPRGYFNGPAGEDRTGIYGAPARYTSNLWRDIRFGGEVPEIEARWRAQARFDLAHWKAGAVVLAPQPNDAALYDVLEKLFERPGKRIGGVWVWDLPPR